MSRQRGYQRELQGKVYEQWQQGRRKVGMQLSTGGGKTVIIGDTIRNFDAPTLSSAHRTELVSQISRTLAQEEIRHDIIAPKHVIRACVDLHMDEMGQSFYNPRSDHKVASVDTIIRRAADNDPWFKRVGLVVPDEAHHVLRNNKWGRMIQMLPDTCYAMMPTATPVRGDRKGLGSHADGMMDALVEGPPMRWIINNGFLTDYRVMCPEPSDLDLSDVHVGAGGEFNQAEVARAVKRSTKIVADVVETYRAKCVELGKWMLGVTFAVDTEDGQRITDAFNAAGIPAVLLTHHSTDDERRTALRKFAKREILQLVNVDLFGEGFDLPAIECVSMARPTASFALFAQQFGRALRLMISKILMAAWDTYSVEQRLAFIAASEKPVAWIFDHVGNIRGNAANPKGHGLPDRQMTWSLDRVDRKRAPSANDAIPMRVCTNPMCLAPYERFHDCCPWCGMVPPPPTLRNRPEYVDGNLLELDPAVLQAMRGEIARVDDRVLIPRGLDMIAATAVTRNHAERQAAQDGLRKAIAYWAGKYHTYSDSANYRRFYLTFGVDVATAMALGAREAGELRAKIEGC